MAAQLQFEFPNFELWHAGTACDHLGAIASQRFRFCVSRLNNLAYCWSQNNEYMVMNLRGYTSIALLNEIRSYQVVLHRKQRQPRRGSQGLRRRLPAFPLASG